MRTPNASGSTGKPLAAIQNRELRELAGRLEDLFAHTVRADGSNQIVQPFSIHQPDGEMLYCCNAMRSRFSIPGQPESFLDAVQIQDRVAAIQALRNASIGHQVEPVEIRLRRPAELSVASAGRFTWYEMSCQRCPGAAGASGNVMASFRDISMRKEAELKLSQAMEEVEAASVAKNRFLANVSHELRTPLNAILGFSELLNSPIAAEIKQEKRTEYVSLIHASARHLLSVLNDILDMSKIETGKYSIVVEPFALAKCLSSTIAMMEGQARPKGINLQLEGLDELPDIVADERAVRQILINLVSNAIKFSEPGQTVTVNAHRRARTVAIEVRDNGIGISEEHLKDLGKPFFQADSRYDRRYEGTGLGLSVVKGLVELHEGTIRFASKRHAGTTVTVTLPIFGSKGRAVVGNESVEKIAVLVPRQRVAAETPDLLSGTG